MLQRRWFATQSTLWAAGCVAVANTNSDGGVFNHAHRAPRTVDECKVLGGNPESFFLCNGVSYCCGVCKGAHKCEVNGVSLEGCSCGLVSCTHLKKDPPQQKTPPLELITQRPRLTESRFLQLWSTHIPETAYTSADPPNHFLLYGVVSGRLVVNPTRRATIRDHLRAKKFEHMALNAITRLPFCVPDVLFYVDFDDNCGCDPRFPAFCYAAQGPSCQTLLMPSYIMWERAHWTRQEVSKVQACQGQVYNDLVKIDKAVWRGGTTGHQAPIEIPESNLWANLARVKLAVIGKAYPDDLDISIVSTVQMSDDQSQAMQRVLGDDSDKRIPEEDFQLYRAVIDVDGNGWSSRFQNLLCLNTVIIKQTTPFLEFSSNLLKANKHYVPVQQDLSDLITKARWIKQQAQSIAGRLRLQEIIEASNHMCRMTSTKNTLSRVLLEGWMVIANWTAPSVNVPQLAWSLKLEDVDPAQQSGHSCGANESSLLRPRTSK
eukprot:m.82582 g.82582  ORF g.82582 m.82582 type:complete len:489 (+) comp11117_c0_seq1:71-1537(+)